MKTLKLSNAADGNIIYNGRCESHHRLQYTALLLLQSVNCFVVVAGNAHASEGSTSCRQMLPVSPSGGDTRQHDDDDEAEREQ